MESKVHYHNTTKPIQLNLISPLTSHFRKNPLFCELPHGSFDFLYAAENLYGFQTTPMRTKFSTYFIFLDFNTSVTGINTFTAIVDLSRFNNSCLKSPASTLVDLTFQSRALRSFSLNQLCNLSL